MNLSVKYVVTKASDDGTFQEGDHIMMNKDMTIQCFEAQGCIEKEDLSEATKGMEYAIDKEWVKRRREKAEAEISFLDSLNK